MSEDEGDLPSLIAAIVLFIVFMGFQLWLMVHSIPTTQPLSEVCSLNSAIERGLFANSALDTSPTALWPQRSRPSYPPRRSPPLPTSDAGPATNIWRLEVRQNSQAALARDRRRVVARAYISPYAIHFHRLSRAVTKCFVTAPSPSIE